MMPLPAEYQAAREHVIKLVLACFEVDREYKLLRQEDARGRLERLLEEAHAALGRLQWQACHLRPTGISLGGIDFLSALHAVTAWAGDEQCRRAIRPTELLAAVDGDLEALARAGTSGAIGSRWWALPTGARAGAATAASRPAPAGSHALLTQGPRIPTAALKAAFRRWGDKPRRAPSGMPGSRHLAAATGRNGLRDGDTFEWRNHVCHNLTELEYAILSVFWDGAALRRSVAYQTLARDAWKGTAVSDHAIRQRVYRLRDKLMSAEIAISWDCGNGRVYADCDVSG
jgi:hypothetical protein